MRRRFIIVWFVLFNTVLNIQAQQSFLKISSFGAQGNYGSFLTVAPKAQYLRDSYTYFGEMFFESELTSREHITTAAIPVWGIGFFFGNTGSKEYIGHMSGLFPYVKFPLFSTSGFRSNLRFGTGISRIQKTYNTLTNHKNVLIGSHINSYINFVLENEWRLSQKAFVHAGLGFSHISNGSTTLPNLGLNIPTAVLGVRYAFHQSTGTAKPIRDTFSRKIFYTVTTSMGVKQSPWIGSNRYIVHVLSAETRKQFSPTGAYGAGIMLCYDPSLMHEVSEGPIEVFKQNDPKWQAGIFASYTRIMGRLFIPLQLGIYAYNKYPVHFFYENIGLAYNASDNWLVTIQLKAHAGQADFIHLGGGYTF